MSHILKFVIGLLASVIALAMVSCAEAAESLVYVPSVSSYADTEAITNVACLVSNKNNRLFTLSLDLYASINNNVSVAFGTDGNGNGVLDREEMDMVLGWDSGAWFYRDRNAKVSSVTHRPDGRRCIVWRLTLRPDRTAKELLASDADGTVFQSAVPSTMFNPNWNIMLVSTRGLFEPNGIVISKLSSWGFKIILR